MAARAPATALQRLTRASAHRAALRTPATARLQHASSSSSADEESGRRVVALLVGGAATLCLCAASAADGGSKSVRCESLQQLSATARRHTGTTRKKSPPADFAKDNIQHEDHENEQEDQQDSDDSRQTAYFDADYETKSLIGAGSFGMVLQCVSKKDGRVAAVKMVQDLSDNQDEVAREKQALASIQQSGGHAHIVRYDGAYAHNGFHYIVTEFVPGQSLHSFLEKRRCVDVHTALQLVAQLADALAFLQASGIVHRDLKPENIMVLDDESSSSSIGDGDSGEQLTLKIIDFGSAGTASRSASGSDSPASSNEAPLSPQISLSGTRCYWSPEVLLNQEMTPAMDMWSLGCLLYILISGRHPFDLMGASSEEQIVQRVTGESVSFLHPVWTQVPSDVKELVRGLLEKDPRARLKVEDVLIRDEHERFMEIEAQLDAWSYEQRLRDATSHSQSVTREYPVALVKTSVTPHDGRVHFHPYKRSLKDNSRESFLRKLQKLDAEEYGEPSPSSSLSINKQQQQQLQQSTKKQKLLEKPQIDWSQEDPLESFRKHSSSLSQLLSKTLDKRISSGRKAPAMGTRITAAAVAPSTKRSELKTMSSASKATPVLKNKVEIDELEVLLQNQRLSRSANDDFFYKNITDRETNILLGEVCHELLWEAAIEAYDDAERASRKRELAPEDLEVVVAAMDHGPPDRVLIQKYQVDITRRTLQCLKPLQWLNDEVINFYFQLLNDRDEALVSSGLLPKRSHFFNSFFYTKVSEGGYNFINVRRWTRKIDLFAMDKIFVPVNISNTHWCMAVIFMTEKRIQYYDSMSGSGSTCLKVLLRYLHDEMEHKKSAKFDEEGWELVPTEEGTPQQANGSDCGVFSCMFADYISLNKPLSFTQKDMEFHRHRMVLRIVRGALPLEEEM